MNEERKNDQEKKDIPLIVPSDIPKIYSTGAYGGYSSYDFRLLFYTEEPLQQDEIVTTEELKVVREVLAEIILSPLAAKQTAEWLSKKVEEFEGECGVIPEKTGKG